MNKNGRRARDRARGRVRRVRLVPLSETFSPFPFSVFAMSLYNAHIYVYAQEVSLGEMDLAYVPLNSATAFAYTLDINAGISVA